MDAKLITSALESLKDGPPTGDSIADCIARFVHHLVGHYMAGVEPWSTELENLFKALKNKKDPMLKDVSLMNQMAAWSAINALRQMKEEHNGKKGT